MSAVPAGHYGLSQIMGPVDPRPGDRVEPLPFEGDVRVRRHLGSSPRNVLGISAKGNLKFEGTIVAFPPHHFRLLKRREPCPSP